MSESDFCPAMDAGPVGPEPKFHSQEAHELRDIVQRLPWHVSTVNVQTDLLRRLLTLITDLENRK